MKENPTKIMILPIIIVALIAAGAGFFGGMKYQQSQRQQFTSQGAGGGFAGRTGTGQGRQGNAAGFRPVAGQIISADDKSITVKAQDGSSRIVIVSDSTSINKSASASRSDLTVGQNVAVFGQQNTDGSVTAQNIQVGDNLRIGGQFRQNGQSNSQQNNPPATQ